MRTFIFFLFPLLVFSGLHAQNTLSGTIEYDSGEPASGAIIRALKMDSSTTIQYTLSQEDGSWELTVYGQDSILLEFRMFGYGSYYELVPDPSLVTRPYRVMLSQQSFSLEEVTVRGEAFGVSRQGDTLSFRLRTFTTGAERTLGDVIKRLPGMELRNGSVYYGGEQITKMLVQGRDIINANHQLATEGIRADQLKEIKIIENYKEASEQFQTQRSEDVAMDVRLKESEENKWSGELELMGGYPSSAKADLHIFNLNDKVGLSGFARANNVGERVLTFRDMMNMMDRQGGRHFRARSSDFINLVPSELSISDQVQANRDAIANFNADIDLTEKINLKGFFMGAYAERESQVFLTKEYLSEGKTRDEEINETTRTPIGNSMWKMEWQLDSNTFVEASLPASINYTTLDETRVGTYDELAFNTSHERDEWNYNISPFAKLRKQIGNDLWTVDARYRKTRQSGDVLYEDIFSFLSIPISPDDSLYRIVQDQTLESQELIVNTKYKTVMGSWFIEPSLEYAWQFDAIDFDASAQGVEDFDRRDELDQQTASASLRGGYETDDWEIIPSVNLNYLDRDYFRENQDEEMYFGYGLQIERKFNRAHNLSFNANYGLQYPTLDQIKNTYKIESSTEVRTGGYPVDLASKGYSASLRYRNFIVKNHSFIFSRISYSYTEDVISDYNEEFDQYILRGYIPAPESQGLNYSMFIGYQLGSIPIRIEPDLSFSWSDGYTTTLAEAFPSERFNRSYGLEFESRWDFPLNVELGGEYDESILWTDRRSDQESSGWEIDLELEYTLGNFRIETDLVYDFAEALNLESDLFILDVEAEYELNKAPLVFRVQANNLLNLDPRERLTSNLTQNEFEIRRFNVFPGYIIAGASWKF